MRRGAGGSLVVVFSFAAGGGGGGGVGRYRDDFAKPHAPGV